MGTATLSAKGRPAQWPPNSHGAGPLADRAEKRRRQPAPARRRHPGLARSWPGRTQVQVAYLKLELSVLLTPAKELRLPPTLFVLVLTLWKRRTPIYAAPARRCPGGRRAMSARLFAAAKAPRLSSAEGMGEGARLLEAEEPGDVRNRERGALSTISGDTKRWVLSTRLGLGAH